MSISPTLLIRKVVSMISANVRPAAACPRNSTPSCARARAIAPIGSLPGRNCAIASPGHQALAKGRPQPAIDERGFPAARCADDGQKARVGQLIDHGIDLVLPAEKQVVLIFPEGPKAGEGVGLRALHYGAHDLAPAAITA